MSGRRPESREWLRATSAAEEAPRRDPSACALRSHLMRTALLCAAWGPLWLGGCADDPGRDRAVTDLGLDASAPLDATGGSVEDAQRPTPGDAQVDASQADAQFLEPTWHPHVRVQVQLDGAPAAGVRVSQGGTAQVHRTDERGVIEVFPVDWHVDGEVALIASHPHARQRSQWVNEHGPPEVRIELARYGPDDPSYRFADPGEPGRRRTTGECGHCHVRINDMWAHSAHRSSAKNPAVHDLYAGTAQYADAPSCEAAGGQWRAGRLPGGGWGERCVLDGGLLAAINPHIPDCVEGDCTAPDFTGGCADCHAPAIDGKLGGRDLLEAEGLAYEYGVSCDVCHRIDEVRREGAPGVAGRLRLHRPSEEAPVSLGGGGKRPLMFGPSHDVPNPRMGLAQRDHFRSGLICMGCHEHHQPPMVAHEGADAWGEAGLPIQTTSSEWFRSPYAPGITCNECHQPPDALAANGGDLQIFPEAEPGVQTGWVRPTGSVRQHRWHGPRQVHTADDSTPLLQLAASVDVQLSRTAQGLSAEVTVRNVGAGHALPTGEPMRHMLLTVAAYCGEVAQPAIGGDAIDELGGALAERGAGEDWSRWPEAQVGDRIWVVSSPGGHYDHPVPAPFDARPAAQRGQPRLHSRGSAQVIAVDGAGVVQLDGPLPEGERAWLVRPDAQWPSRAGAPGFSFGKILVGADGQPQVHHGFAVDLLRDNRLPPLATVRTQHLFEASCDAPEVEATLYYRPYPWALARARNWPAREQRMAHSRRTLEAPP